MGNKHTDNFLQIRNYPIIGDLDEALDRVGLRVWQA